MLDKKKALRELFRHLVKGKSELSADLRHDSTGMLEHLCDQLDQLAPALHWNSGHAPGDRDTPMVFVGRDPRKRMNFLCISRSRHETEGILTVSSRGEPPEEFLVFSVQEFCDILENALDAAWSPDEEEGA